MKRFRTDGGGEYTSKMFTEYLKSYGFLKETTPSYSHRSNDVIKQANRTIMECVRCMLEDAVLLRNYWAFAVPVVVHLKNRTPARSGVVKNPYGAWHRSREMPSLKQSRVSGSLAFVHFPKDKRKMVDYRATPGIFVGYSISTKQYFSYDPRAKMLHRSRDVVIREGRRYTAPNAADQAIMNEHFLRVVIEDPKPTGKQPTGDGNSELHREEPLGHDSASDALNSKTKSRESAGLETSLVDEWKLPAKGRSQNRAGEDSWAESAQCALEDDKLEDMILMYASVAISDNHRDAINRKSYKVATVSPLADKWDMAIKEELDPVGQHQVFGHFVELPEER